MAANPLRFLMVALTLRLICLIINNYLFYLPDGDMDGLVFEKLAWEWSQVGFLNLLEKFTGPSAHFLSYIIAIPYTLFGRSFLMAQSFSIFLVLVQFFFKLDACKKNLE